MLVHLGKLELIDSFTEDVHCRAEDMDRTSISVHPGTGGKPYALLVISLAHGSDRIRARFDTEQQAIEARNRIVSAVNTALAGKTR
jgi:hypothetical protein